MLFMSKYRHKKILEEMEEKHRQELQHKEDEYNHKLRKKDNAILDLQEKNERLTIEHKVQKYDLKSKIRKVDNEKEELEKINKTLKSKVEVSCIVKDQLKGLCEYTGDKKELMYSFNLTPVNVVVSGKRVYDLAQLLG